MKHSPTNNSSIREELRELLKNTSLYQIFPKEDGDNLDKTVDQLETLITTHTDQILDELESKLPDTMPQLKGTTDVKMYNSQEYLDIGVVFYNDLLDQVKQTIKLYRGMSNE